MADYIVEFGAAHVHVEADGRMDAPSFHRNHAPILAVLERCLAGRSGDVLEVGSGTGQHVIELARHSPDITFWPSDVAEPHLQSISGWRAQARLKNVAAPLRADLSSADWARAILEAGLPRHVLAVVCANVVHIAPWRVAEGLFSGARSLLRADGRLFLYGAFRRNGRHTAPSNAVFDASLRAANPEWGVRDVADLERLARSTGLGLSEIIEMPANNLMLVFAPLTSAVDAWPAS